MATLANQKATAVHLLISTPGGNVMNGLNLYNMLIGLPFELVSTMWETSILSAMPSF
jgi:ATP-dependent protease ClpP protease subunit